MLSAGFTSGRATGNRLCACRGRSVLVLTRESIRNGIIEKFARQAGADFQPLSRAEREASRTNTLADVPAGEDIWVFGYGSLIWNPAFHFEEQRLGRLFGYHRRFCLQIMAGCGSTERPGLMLALDRGGSCRGVVFRIRHDLIDEETSIIWQREMISGAYMPRWLGVQTAGGQVRAVTFVVNPAYERYTPEIPEPEMVEALANARGPLGACSEYLYNTTAHLEAMGIGDRKLKRLSQAVATRQGLATVPHLDDLEPQT